MHDFEGITHLSFDCYGTLIDWESGILGALQPLLQSHGVRVEPKVILELYVKHEARLEAGPWRLYREILRLVSANIAQELGAELSEFEQNVLPESVGSWPPFPDTVAALQELGRRFKLVIVSNIDDALFAGTAGLLKISFSEVITAEQVRSYKPGEAHFDELLRRSGAPPQQILHVAQSLYHDHAPAKRRGLGTVWVNRTSRLAGTGIAPKAVVNPDLKVQSLGELVEIINESQRGV
jgi:2-haloacid dehalogenase